MWPWNVQAFPRDVSNIACAVTWFEHNELEKRVSLPLSCSKSKKKAEGNKYVKSPFLNQQGVEYTHNSQHTGSHSLRSNSASRGANHPQQMFRNVQLDLWQSSEEQPSQPLVHFFSSVLQGQGIEVGEDVSTTILFPKNALTLWDSPSETTAP